MKRISEEEKIFIESNRRYSDHSLKYPWKKILKNRSLLALLVAFSTSQCANYFFLAWGQIYLRDAKHFSGNEIKWTYFIGYSLAAIACFFSGHLCDWLIKIKGIRFGRRSLGFTILAVTGLAMLTQPLASNHMIISLLFITGIAVYSSIGIPSYGTCVDIGGSRAATVSGIMNFCGQFTAFLFVLFFGKIVDALGFAVPVYLLAVALLTGSLLWFFVDPSKPLVVHEKANPVLNQLEPA